MKKFLNFVIIMSALYYVAKKFFYVNYKNKKYNITDLELYKKIKKEYINKNKFNSFF